MGGGGGGGGYKTIDDSPPVHFHVLPVEEEYGGRNEGDIKVLRVDGHSLHIYNIHVRHLGQGMLVLGKLRINQRSQVEYTHIYPSKYYQHAL